MKRKFTVKYRAWLGYEAAKEKSRLQAMHGKKKSVPFIANTLKLIDKEEFLADKRSYQRLKSLVKRAHKNFKHGHFVEAEVFFESKRYRTSCSTKKAPHPVAIDLYQWYLQLAPGQRKTRRLFYDQIAVLNKKYENNPDVHPINLSNRKRRTWLARWAKRFNVSFRKVNKKYKLRPEECERRLGIQWRDMIRIRRGLSEKGNVPIQSWDQTPLWEALEGEETAVSTGSHKVAVNVSHDASRKKFTVVLSMTSMKGYPAAPETVIFAFPSGGKRVTKVLEQEIAKSEFKGGKEAAQSIDAPMAFKQAGLTNALDGSEDQLIASHLKPVWEKLKVAEWRAEYLDKHQPGQMDPLVLWHNLESVLPLDDDMEESDDPTDGEGVDEDESDDGVDGDNGNDEDSDDEDGDNGGEAQPLPDVVMFKQAMQLTNETGSPRLQACLKRYISLKENERKTKARRLLAQPNRIPLDAGLEPVDGDPFVQQEDAPAPPPAPANPIDVPGGEVRDEWEWW